MFDGMIEFDLHLGDNVIHGRHGGQRPPLLTVAWHPQTHVMWGSVDIALTTSHTVVAADLRGFGASETPASTADHAPY